MAASLPKVPVGKAVALPLGFASKGATQISQLAKKYEVGTKFEELSSHKYVAMLGTQKELMLALLGLVLVFHGAQFKNLVLCTQLFASILVARVAAIYEDLKKVKDKTEADAPAPEPKETEDEKNKHAKKRDAKKAAADKGSADDDMQVHIETSKKMLKALDADRIASTSKELLVCLMACILVIHGGFARCVAVAHALVTAVSTRLAGLFTFEGFEDIEPWVMLLVTVGLWIAIFPMALVLAPFALMLNIAAVGADLAVKHGFAFAGKIGQLQDAEAKLASPVGFFAFAGFVAIGTIYQLWTWAAGDTISWYFNFLYFPAVVAEYFLSCL
mmetsp:Transcript_6798/g.9694  ORF Transcript_6798/g.9694 Transcript_6798/m.9694 type:complete len:330 (-) Transcript_6798:240-1229(-)|eukprot:CAMPEP_0194754520 /NCGR_PEP_ID=MMETSP0323_2-20130528/8477_1 /TAXON_ID=2866 ORGANISM="Crypthecodinium cohnii, Strain Seligo" /NCGR_SAMPLE_ID=MMETSP0323_2 /ASSEMBLY_ACC=CAM_ASM_000346 /LENGTH=329 /DNA_ID=CAMNT_0039673105 /DNA_START=65 /DNA_END=1054 /DNA_ORIENTATION=+